MYSSTETAVAGPKKPAKNLIGAFQIMWRLMVVVFFYWLLAWESLDLLPPFIRSIVVCPVPLPMNGKCPTGSLMDKQGDCLAVPKFSTDWSGSVHCANNVLVISKSTATVGKLTLLTSIAKILSQVFVGAAILDTLGRKPVLIIGIAALSMLMGVLWFTCHVPMDKRLLALMPGLFIVNLADSFHAASTAMVSDLASGDGEWQTLGFALINIFRHLAIILAFGAGFPILSMYLEDYTTVWGIGFLLACVAVMVAAIILHETMGSRAASAGSPLLVDEPPETRRPDGLEGGGGGAGAGSSDAEEALEAVKMANVMAETRTVWNDLFFSGFMFLILIFNIAAYGSIAIIGGYGLEVVKLRQDVVSLLGVLQAAVIVLGSCTAAYTLEGLGEARTYMLGVTVTAVGQLAVAFGALFHGFTVVGFWAGWAIVGIGFGLSEPAANKILAQRAGKKNYGIVFASKMFMENLGMAVGSYVWSNYIFIHAHGLGLAASFGFLMSAVLLGGVFVVFSLLIVACPL
mmetsp:Transcript_10639/g.33626  ORF Transcript_10639/g.33626 Transcript_10639/m.33626 type:complete len:516 (+) Transcript_10639:56-1603(+)